MDITITARRIELTDALKSYTKKKISRVKKYLEGHIEANAVLTVEKYRHIADVSINADGFSVHGEEKTEDMYSSIDRVMDKIERQIKKNKDKSKIIATKKNNHVRILESIPEQILVNDDTDSIPEIIESDNYEPKPMSPEEAALQMEISTNTFLVFINSLTNSMNVIYRRNDGNLGLIAPKIE